MRSTELSTAWKKQLVGQDHVIDRITPYIVRAMAGMNVPGRPLGVFFLMGPTGTGKTRTAETLAEVLHGSEKNVLRIDCGEFQSDHEIAKMLGAPPGYLGHRETQPLITQIKLTGMTSNSSTISIVLFDEIEKAAGTMWRALLGIMDKGVLRLGDNSMVSFENTVIFMSSNLGAKDIASRLSGGYGFTTKSDEYSDVTTSNVQAIEKIGAGALRKRFPPEFPNRIDEIITFYPLSQSTLDEITRIELLKCRNHMLVTLGKKGFYLTYTEETVSFISRTGTSLEYGARELNRVITRHVVNPLADEIVDDKILPFSSVNLDSDGTCITWQIEAPLISENDSSVPSEAPTPKSKARKMKAAA